MTTRLDLELVRRSLTKSRSEARDLIRGGSVQVDGRVEFRPAARIHPDTEVAIDLKRVRWVSRGGIKLDAALDHFEVAVAGRRCVDVGASTGGFTEVLLARGADSVAALDVGHGQIAPHIAADPRVTSLEGRNVRDASATGLGGCFELTVVDLSFISLLTVAAPLADLTCEGGDAVLLIKPQFEVGRERVGSGGVVRDPDARSSAVQTVLAGLNAARLGPQAIMESPVEGGDGNVEYLVWAVKGAAATPLEVPK